MQAFVDKNHCLAYAFDRLCIVCVLSKTGRAST